MAIINFHFVILHRVLNRFVKLLSDTEKKGEDKVNQELKEMREALEEKSKGAAKFNMGWGGEGRLNCL